MANLFEKITIVGSGAAGGYYGALLARAGSQVRFLARRDLDVLRTRGLAIRGAGGDFDTGPLQAHASASDIGLSDLVIVALKTTDNDQLPRLIAPLLHSGTTILTVQNGLGSDEFLARYGAQRVVGAICFVNVARRSPGEIQCNAAGNVTLGEFAGPATVRTRELSALLTRAAVQTSVTEGLAEARWRKLVWNVPFNGLAVAAGGVGVDEILGNERLAARARAIMLEVAAAAGRYGHFIPDGYVDLQLGITSTFGPYKPASVADFKAGQDIEIPAIWGEPLWRGEAAGLAMPELSFLHRELSGLVATR